MFQHIAAYAGDPILKLNEAYQCDSHLRKVNLSIGVYLDEQGGMPVMRAVRNAESHILENIDVRPYLPMEGATNYRRQAQCLVFGEDSDAVLENRVTTVQTVGGSGALKVGADFLRASFPGAQIWVSDPSWDNHQAIFTGAGFSVRSYPYYSQQSRQVDFEAMRSVIEALPKGDIVLLHASCHNPTGADLTKDQWKELAHVFKERSLVPFFDMAYQGFCVGIGEDAYAIRHFASEGVCFLVANSFSKNFSLYGERCGALSVVCPNAEQAERVLGQLIATVRQNYSSPPTHGSRIVATILSSEQLRREWMGELDAMRLRIMAMRVALHDALKARRPKQDFAYLLQQKGMFSFTGLSSTQIRCLREEYGIYLIENGRACISTLTRGSIDAVADAFAQVSE
jgi:aromatic-amino-acid transaminase